MTRDEAKRVGAEIEADVAEIAKRHHLQLRPIRARFDPGEAGGITFKLELERTATPSGAAVEPRETRDFRTYALSFGLRLEHLGATFRVGGRSYTVTGLRPRASKRPVITRRDDGKTFVFDADLVRRSIEVA